VTSRLDAVEQSPCDTLYVLRIGKCIGNERTRSDRHQLGNGSNFEIHAILSILNRKALVSILDDQRSHTFLKGEQGCFVTRIANRVERMLLERPQGIVRDGKTMRAHPFRSTGKIRFIVKVDLALENQWVRIMGRESVPLVLGPIGDYEFPGVGPRAVVRISIRQVNWTIVPPLRRMGLERLIVEIAPPFPK